MHLPTHRRTSPILIAGLSLQLLGTAACTGDATASADLLPVVRDSAGNEIVEHSAELVARLPEWGVVGDPIIDLGGGADPAEEFTSIRGAVRLRDGRILLGEGGSNELRLFDERGQFLQTLARQGEGPGEFRFIGRLDQLDDGAVLVTDGNLRRSTLYSSDGHLLRLVADPRPSQDGIYFGVSTIMTDGRLLLGVYRFGTDPTSPSGPVARDTYALAIATADGATLDTLRLVPGAEMYPGVFNEGGRDFIGRTSLAFGRSTSIASDGRRVLVGTNEQNEVWQYDGQALLRILRDQTPPEAVTEEHRALRLRESLARIDRLNFPEGVKAQARKQAQEARYAEVFPFYDRLLIGTDGSIWVEAVRRFEDEGRRYVVYGSDGRALARVVFPDRVRPLQVGPTELIGMWRDPDEVPHLRVWRVGPAQR